MSLTERSSHFLLPALIVLLLASWVCGGVTEDATALDEFLQLLALPVLVLALATLGEAGGLPRMPRWGLWIALLVVLVPLLQLLPMPSGLWRLPAARQALAADLAQAGVGQAYQHWTLSPFATERSLWALLPAMAAFTAAIAIPPQARRRVLQAVVVLVLFNILFAFFQAGLPRESALRLYPQAEAGFGGLLANTNHQATACIVGMVLCVGLAVEARLRAQRNETRPHTRWWYAALAGFLLMMVPLSTARAGMAIALPALAAALVFTGGLPLARIGRGKRATVLAVGLAVFALIGVRAALGWMAVDQAEELRHTMAAATAMLGQAHAPLGSGEGSFVPVFEQATPPALQLAYYINHAHNEYAQWWLTAGWLGMLVLAAALALLAAAGWQLARMQGRGSNAILAGACLVAVCAVLAHSWADYPLRTTALMATTAALAGLMLAALADAMRRRQSSGAPSRGSTLAGPDTAANKL